MRMRRINASSLNYTILLFILITTIISAILIYNYFLKLRQVTRVQKLETLGNCESGLNYLLAIKSQPCKDKFDSTIVINDNKDSIELKATAWGGYNILSSSVLNNRFPIQKIGICTNYYIGDSTPTLYLKNSGHPLTLCLNSKIQGEVYIPEATIRYELMNGNSFSGSRVKKEFISNSNDTLPELSKYFGELNMDNIINSYDIENKRLSICQLQTDSIFRSFKDNTQIIHPENNRIDWNYVGGNIIIVADSLLVIPNTSTLNDIIVIGKDIIIESGFKGVLQCFAKNSIEVENNVSLKYPSGLYLIPEKLDENKRNETNNAKSIFLGENVIISGIVFSNYSFNYSGKNELLLNINKNSIVKGIVYWPGSFQLMGEVRGQVFSDSFYIKNAFGYYNNYVANGTISKMPTEDNTVLPGLFSNSNTGKITKWIN